MRIFPSHKNHLETSLKPEVNARTSWSEGQQPHPYLRPAAAPAQADWDSQTQSTPAPVQPQGTSPWAPWVEVFIASPHTQLELLCCNLLLISGAGEKTLPRISRNSFGCLFLIVHLSLPSIYYYVQLSYSTQV